MRRHWKVWLIFAACLLVVVAAIAWTSAMVLEMERYANVEEPVRLALWRLDSQLAPIFVEESSRPYEHYGSFYEASNAYDRKFAAWGNDDVLIPSPLLTQKAPFIRLHFQYDATNSLTSPQCPKGDVRKLAGGSIVPPARLDEMTTRLAELGELHLTGSIGEKLQQASAQEYGVSGTTAPADLLAVSPADRSRQRTRRTRPSGQQPEEQQMDGGRFPQMAAQSVRNRGEAQARKNTYRRVESQQVHQNLDNNMDLGCVSVGGLPSTAIDVGIMHPFWVAENLVFARRVNVLGQPRIQGCWLDWDVLKATLLEDIADLLPDADLAPITTNDDSAESSRTLAWLPVELIEGEPAKVSGSAWRVRIPLLVAWSGVGLAALAVGGLLFGTLALSERRASFVSAVTHELRTPLTTFQMYTEMLAGKMVTDETKRTQYLETLKGEAIRLGHMVENVLAYARLEKGRAAARTETLAVTRLLETIQNQLKSRAEQGGMKLVVDQVASTDAITVLVDVSAFEQILSNLVDNACKHAAEGTDKTIHLELATPGRSVAFRVRDHGPGVAPTDIRRLFKPFSKSAEEAASSAPGVGLGLALCRRLARAMGGDLELYDGGGQKAGFGACFELTLARVSE